MAELISTQTTAAQSADFTLTSTDVATLSLKNATSGVPTDGGVAEIQLKSVASGTYMTIGYLTKSDPCLVLSAPGTYRINKPISTIAFGVDQA